MPRLKTQPIPQEKPVRYVPKRRNTVEPIRNERDLEKVKRVLKKSSLRDYCIFIIGVNTNLRGGDIVNLRHRQVRRAFDENTPITLYESKTGQKRIIPLNSAIREALTQYFEAYDFDDTDTELLFTSKENRHLSSSALSKSIKRACKSAGLRGNYAAHTMRKTWAYFQRTRENAALPLLVKALNHSTQRQTMEYMGIVDEEIHDLYKMTL